MTGAEAPPPPGVLFTPAEAQAALQALAWVLTRRPAALLDAEGEALLAAHRKLAAFVTGRA